MNETINRTKMNESDSAKPTDSAKCADSTVKKNKTYKLRAFWTLFKTEFKLSLRNMNMVIFAIFMPLVLLAIFGFTYGTKQSFPGEIFASLCGVSICAGGLMGLPLVVSEYREKKILKRFKVTPVSPLTLLAAECAIYFLYSFVSLLTLFCAALVLKVKIAGSVSVFWGSWLLTLVSTLSLGMLVGGTAKNTKSAGVMASILYFPMLVFSGATVPVEIMPEALQKAVSVFPLAQGISLMKQSFAGLPKENMAVPLVSMGALTVLCAALSVKFFKWE